MGSVKLAVVSVSCVLALTVGATAGLSAAADAGTPERALAENSRGILAGPLGLPTIFPPTPAPVPTTPPATTMPSSSPTAMPVPSDTPTAAAPATPPAGTFEGPDGKRYPAGNQVTRGNNGHDLYLGEDFDLNCYDGKYFRRGMNHLQEIAQEIRKSGRKVVFTVAPNKAAVMPKLLKGVKVPHGSCTRRGLSQQDKVLDDYPGKLYLPLRQALIDDPHRTYWPADPHWTNFGSVVFAKALASRLAPRLVDSLRYRPTIDELPQILLEFLGETHDESIRSTKGLEPAGKTKIVVPSDEQDISPSVITTFDHRWTTSPKKATYRGKTLLIGDSFTYLSLRSLRPIFASGRFVWNGVVPNEDIVQGILDSNTVVIEVVQRYVSRSVLNDADFRDLLAAGLSSAPLKHSRTDKSSN